MQIRRLIFLGLLGAALIGCGSESSTGDAPIVVIGIDSADWHWIDPLIEEGRMPNYGALVERGVRAHLQSFRPLEKSPVIWTSIATGKLPEKHGIGGFTKGDSKLTGSLARTAATYWEILGSLGKTQAVIGWWVTYPATRVNGVLISDYVQYYPSGRGKVVGSVYPDSVWSFVEEARVNPADITLEDLARFIDLEIALEHREAAEERLKELKWIYAADETFRRVARALYAAGEWEVFTVYFRGLDPACHSYWAYFEPKRSGRLMKDWEIQLMGQIVPRYYEYTDELLGEVISYIDPASQVMVMSDHGFRGHRSFGGSTSLGVQMHRDKGILILAGPAFETGIRLEKAGVLDVMPTLLATAGVPPASDLDGMILMDAFRPDWRARLEARAADEVESYEGIVPPRSSNVSPDQEVDEEILRRLRSLGYID